MNNNQVKIDCNMIRGESKTGMAICADVMHHDKITTNVWFPLSTVHFICHDPHKPYLIVDKWIAEQKGFSPK